jgi:hypothetical protein
MIIEHMYLLVKGVTASLIHHQELVRRSLLVRRWKPDYTGSKAEDCHQ